MSYNYKRKIKKYNSKKEKKIFNRFFDEKEKKWKRKVNLKRRET